MHKKKKPRRTVRALRTRVIKVTPTLRKKLDGRVCCMNRLTGGVSRLPKAIICIGDLAQYSRAKLRRRLARWYFEAMELYLDDMGLSFGMKILEWKRPDPLPPHPDSGWKYPMCS